MPRVPCGHDSCDRGDLGALVAPARLRTARAAADPAPAVVARAGPRSAVDMRFASAEWAWEKGRDGG